mgnify:FL=1
MEFKSELTQQELEKLYEDTEKTLLSEPSARVGQALMINMDLDMYSRVTGTTCDPFYNSDNLSACIKKICPQHLHDIYVDKFNHLKKLR